MATQRLNDIHNLRALVIALIVSVHTIDTFFVVENTSWLLQIIWGLTSDASSAFVFIAGFLFQHLSTKFAYPRYLYKKWLNVVLPYLIVTLPFIIKRLYENHALFQDYPLYQKIALYYLTGSHVLYLWFIPMIILFFLAAPVFIRLDKNPKFYPITLLILLIVALLINRELVDPFACFVHYSIFYVFGMFASHYRQAFVAGCQRWIGFIVLGATLFVTSQIIFHYHFDLIREWFFNPFWLYLDIIPLFFALSTLKWLFLIPLMGWLLYQFDGFVQNKPALLADMSFGVYFIHGYAISFIVTVMAKLGAETQHLPDSTLYFVLLLGAVVLLCMSALAVVKWLFGQHSRMLVGY